jgi:hypothetical protein
MGMKSSQENKSKHSNHAPNMMERKLIKLSVNSPKELMLMTLPKNYPQKLVFFYLIELVLSSISRCISGIEELAQEKKIKDLSK